MENQNNESILARLQTYQPPPFPVSKYLDRDTYDYRITSKNPSPVPKTIEDTFIFDVLMNADKFGIHRQCDAWLFLRIVYLAKDFKQFGGFKMWTFWNFVQTLGFQERVTLEFEVRRLLDSGRDWKNELYDLWEIPQEYRD